MDGLSYATNQNPRRQWLCLILFDFLGAEAMIQSTYETMHLVI